MRYTIKTMNCVGEYLFPCKMKSLDSLSYYDGWASFDLIKNSSDLTLVIFATRLQVRIKLQDMISHLVYSEIQIKKKYRFGKRKIKKHTNIVEMA